MLTLAFGLSSCADTATTKGFGDASTSATTRNPFDEVVTIIGQ